MPPSRTPARTPFPTPLLPDVCPAPWPIALTIAGFDPSAGAGILADLKTFAAHGIYGMACITALTVQSTQGVQRVEPVFPSTLTETAHCLAGDVRFATIKIGMLATKDLAGAVVDFLSTQTGVVVVLDPILLSSSGSVLLDLGGQQLLRTRLLARANWITPNVDELAALTGRAVTVSRQQTESSAQALLQMAADLGNPHLRVVVTGGHSVQPDDLLIFMLANSDADTRQPPSRFTTHWFPGKRIETQSTHGTGCTFSSAIAARLALGEQDPFAAVAAAKAYVTGALQAATPIGHGHVPLHHFWNQPHNHFSKLKRY